MKKLIFILLVTLVQNAFAETTICQTEYINTRFVINGKKCEVESKVSQVRPGVQPVGHILNSWKDLPVPGCLKSIVDTKAKGHPCCVVGSASATSCETLKITY